MRLPRWRGGPALTSRCLTCVRTMILSSMSVMFIT
mgnify:CR=1 FL=1